MVAEAATGVFRPSWTTRSANAVIAIESAFPVRGLTLEVGMARDRAANAAFYFTGWRCRFIAANTGLSTVASPGDTLRAYAGYGAFEGALPAGIYSVQPLLMISRGPRAMPTGGLLRPEFGNKPSMALPEGVPPA